MATRNATRASKSDAAVRPMWGQPAAANRPVSSDVTLPARPACDAMEWMHSMFGDGTTDPATLASDAYRDARNGVPVDVLAGMYPAVGVWAAAREQSTWDYDPSWGTGMRRAFGTFAGETHGGHTVAYTGVKAQGVTERAAGGYRGTLTLYYIAGIAGTEYPRGTDPYLTATVQVDYPADDNAHGEVNARVYIAAKRFPTRDEAMHAAEAVKRHLNLA